MPVGDPKLDVDLEHPPAEGQALEFSIEIGVLPKAELGDYKGLEVAAPRAGRRGRADRAEIEGLRERLARSRPPSARPPRATSS